MTQPPIRLALFGLINTYLVPEKDGLTLIDTGMPTLAPGLLKKVRQIGKPIRRILLTHGHDDHVMGLDLIRKEFPEAEVLMHAADEHYLKRCGQQTRPDRFLQGGEQLGPFNVIAAPGHSEGHLAYLDERDGTLYAGDSFVNVPNLRVCTELHPLFPMPTFGTWNADVARATAHKLAELEGMTWLALGHGRPLREPRQAMQAAVERAAQQRHPDQWQLGVARKVADLMGGAKGHI